MKICQVWVPDKDDVVASKCFFRLYMLDDGTLGNLQYQRIESQSTKHKQTIWSAALDEARCQVNQHVKTQIP